MFIIPDANMPAILTAIAAQLGTAATGLVHVHLYTNNFTPDKNSLLAAFTELTAVEVPGYAAKSVNWFAGVPFRRNDGQWEDPSSLADPSFVATGPPPAPQVVYGFFLTDSTDAILLGSGLFDAPFTFQNTGDGFTLPGNLLLNQGDSTSLTLTFPDLVPV